MTDFLPAADHVETFFYFFQKTWDLGGVVLQVAIHRDYGFSTSCFESSPEGRRLAEISAKANCPYATIVDGELSDDFPGVIRRSIVHPDDFDFVAETLRQFHQFCIQWLQVVSFVLNWND